MTDRDPSEVTARIKLPTGQEVRNELDVLLRAGRRTYTFLERLGHGGQANVYKVVPASLPTEIRALKVLRTSAHDPAISDEDREAFIREARLLTSANGGANLCQVHNVGLFTEHFDTGLMDGKDHLEIKVGDPFIEMEFVEGEDLERTLTRISTKRRLEIAVSVAKGLVQLHGLEGGPSIAHRDLKPPNIMIETRSGGVKIVDLGSAKEFVAGVTTSGSSVHAGSRHWLTADFASPEQAQAFLTLRGEHGASVPSIGTASDVFSFGSILYWLLLEKAPFTGPTLEVLRQISKLPAQPAQSLLMTSFPARLCMLIRMMHEPDPSKRPRANQVLNELEQVAANYREVDEQELK